LATAPLTCFAIAAPGLEPIVAQELRDLGEQPRIEEGGVEWTGDARSVARANIWLRSASRVLVRVAQFPATAFYELEKRAKKIPWADYITSDATATFRVTARKSRLYHSDAIAERLVAAAARGRKSTKQPAREQLFVVRVARDVVVISADTSGELLHRRGYRQAVAKAPLRETLAAALLLAAEWKGDAPLIDPFCGSGTIPIEGALRAQRTAPGLQRHFDGADMPLLSKEVWQTAFNEARASALASSPVPILGSDRDSGAVEDARANAQRARADVQFAVAAISDAAPSGDQAGLVATNPPYGVRVGDPTKLRNLYARLGDVLRERFAGWRLAMFVADERTAGHTKLELRPLFRTTNGGLSVTAMLADIPR
jgi:putative N6-adenine-specific DNA methylase